MALVGLPATVRSVGRPGSAARVVVIPRHRRMCRRQLPGVIAPVLPREGNRPGRPDHVHEQNLQGPDQLRELPVGQPAVSAFFLKVGRDILGRMLGQAPSGMRLDICLGVPDVPPDGGRFQAISLCLFDEVFPEPGDGVVRHGAILSVV